MISPNVLIEGTDPEAFSISINQAVECTATRIQPMAPDLNRYNHLGQRRLVPQPRLIIRDHNAEAIITTQEDAVTQRGQLLNEGSSQLSSMLPYLPNNTAQKSQDDDLFAYPTPDFSQSPPADDINIVYNPSPLSIQIIPNLQIPSPIRPVDPLNASTIHPAMMQHLRLTRPRLYHTYLSRELHNPRPKTPQCPPPIPFPVLQTYHVQRRTFYYRQGLAWQFLKELDENGWISWERTMLDVDAIARDFTEISDWGGTNEPSDAEIRDLLASQHVETPTVEAQDAAMVRYTDGDEIEEDESEDEVDVAAGVENAAEQNASTANLNIEDINAMTEHEKKVKAMDLARRRNDKRVALFLADVMIETNRIKEMGF